MSTQIEQFCDQIKWSGWSNKMERRGWEMFCFMKKLPEVWSEVATVLCPQTLKTHDLRQTTASILD